MSCLYLKAELRQIKRKKITDKSEQTKKQKQEIILNTTRHFQAAYTLKRILGK